ncbi:MAG: DUF3226 domain-containing protein [Rhabdochlamydiaceae bacterium]
MNSSIIKEANLLNDLWVEGSDDAQLLYHLLKRYHLEKDVKIEKKDGVENILKNLKIALKVGGPGKLGIIVDVDDDLSQRWQSFQALLEEAGYVDIPALPVSSGTIIVQDGLLDIGIWLMPDNQMTGMVEHFVKTLIPPEYLLWSMAGDAVQRAMAIKCHFALVHQMKAEIHTWLAWQEEPGKPIGLMRSQKREIKPPKQLEDECCCSAFAPQWRKSQRAGAN